MVFLIIQCFCVKSKNASTWYSHPYRVIVKVTYRLVLHLSLAVVASKVTIQFFCE